MNVSKTFQIFFENFRDSKFFRKIVEKLSKKFRKNRGFLTTLRQPKNKCVPTSNDIALHSKRLDLQSPLAWVINKGPYQGYWNLDRRRREHSCLSSRKKISLGAGQGLVDQNQNKKQWYGSIGRFWPIKGCYSQPQQCMLARLASSIMRASI